MTKAQIQAIYERHADTVYRVCLLYFKSRAADVEDAVQNTFIKLLHCEKAFANAEHEKAWLIVVASNVCRNMLKSAWKRKVSLNEHAVLRQTADEQYDDTVQCVMALPERYKASIYLHYYEGYKAREIAMMLGKREATVWGYLHKGRILLKEMLEEGERYE